MSDRRIYEITLASILQGGVTCKNPTIEWEKHDCVNVRCDVKDKKWTVEIPEYCDDPCVYITVDCSEDCSLCEPERIRLCPCDNDAQCGACEECVNGMCVSKCPAGEFCLDTGVCGNCDDSHPCPDGKICVNGHCTCPPNKPFQDSQGNCSDCNDDNPCPPCYRCTPTGCVPLECEHCDTATGQCVECFNNTHCSGANECCVNDRCDCCDGFVRDLATGNCIPAPECVRDTDCGTCQTCNNGHCQDVQCPPGYVRLPGMPCCAKACDCADPSCPNGENCVRLDNDHCYCASCSGGCSKNGDCGEGCFCDNGQCRPNPCYGNCNNGFDCGDGCGCEDGECVPCSSLSCFNNDCNKVNGCYCNGNECEKKGCGGDCFNGGECPPGCGCYQGQCVDCADIPCENCKFAAGCACVDGIHCVESNCDGYCVDADDCGGVNCGCDKSLGSCVDCSAYGCANGEKCPDGCVCVNGTCQGNPCASTYCADDGDCGTGCECVNGMCQPCDGGNPNCGNTGCSDVLMVTKVDDGCDLKATLTTKNCCECEAWSVGLKLNALVTEGDGSKTLTGELQLRGGTQPATWSDFLNKPFLSNYGDNVLPISGKFKVSMVNEYGNGTYVEIKSATVDVTNKDNYTVGDTPKIEFKNVPTPGMYYYVGGQTRPLIKTTIKIETHTNVELENGCKTKLNENVVVVVNKSGQMASYGTYSRAFEMVNINLCKKQKLTWYRGDTSNFGSSTQIKVAWMDLVSSVGSTNLYEHKLQTVAEGLLYGKYYWAVAGCSCNKTPRPYSCNPSSNVPNKLTFDPEIDLDFTVSQCCTRINWNTINVNCDIMQNASPAVKYDLYVNGASTGTSYTLQANGILIPGATHYTHTSPISSVGLKPQLSECPTQMVTKEILCAIIDAQPELVVDACYTTGDISVKVNVTGGAPGQKVVDIDNGIDPVVTASFYSNSVTVPNVPAQTSNYTVTVTDANGCITTKVIPLDLGSFGAADNLLVETGCAGGSPFIRFTNNYNVLSISDVDGDLVSVPAGQYVTRTAPSGTPFNWEFYVADKPSCKVSRVGEVVLCCGSINYDNVGVDNITCVTPLDVNVELHNNEAFPVIFSFENASGATIHPDVPMLPSGSDIVPVTMTNDLTVVIKVRADVPGTCPKYHLHTYNGSECSEVLLDNMEIGYTCTGNGRGDIYVHNNNTPQVEYKVYINNALVYTGTANYLWQNIPNPGTFIVKVELLTGQDKTETLVIDCRV